MTQETTTANTQRSIFPALQSSSFVQSMRRPAAGSLSIESNQAELKAKSNLIEGAPRTPLTPYLR